MNIFESVLQKLNNQNLKISFAESCTGGMLVSFLVSVPGASNVLEESYVTYSEDAKKKILGVKQETLEKYTVYSKEVAIEMVEGLYNASKSNVCVSITGECGNGDDYSGCAYVGILYNQKLYTYVIEASGSRSEIREKYSFYVYQILDKIL